uniref:Uncharacterized protein n=1 Tax=Rhizobium phage IG49 TaxID=3129228 RepID=A0AAU8HYC7_9CAUD
MATEAKMDGVLETKPRKMESKAVQEFLFFAQMLKLSTMALSLVAVVAVAQAA